MKKTLKKFSCLLTSVLLSVCMLLPFNAMAAENDLVGVSPVSPVSSTEISPYSTVKPSKVWNLETKGTYKFHGTNIMDTLYSNYMFTGVTRVRIHIENTGSKSIMVRLLKSQTGIDFAVTKNTVEAGESLTWTAKVEKNRKYILRFEHGSSFSGYIEKA